MIHPSRIQRLNEKPARDGRYILYWMQASQRAECNHALEYAVAEANRLGRPLVVYFGLTDGYPGAAIRHYAFMLEGLREVAQRLAKRGIRFVLRRESPERGIVKMADDAALVVTDRGYTRIQRQWRQAAAKGLACPLVQVESDVVAPVETVSNKEEFAARTIRPKIHRHLQDYLVPLKTVKAAQESVSLDIRDESLDDIAPLLAHLKIDRSVPAVTWMKGGASEARRRLKQFLAKKLSSYDSHRNDPTVDGTSHLSPYLHFGQISPLQIALEVLDSDGDQEGPFLEELIIRRELAMNYCQYNADYDSYAALPDWCLKTLAKHRADRRPYTYSREQLEHAETHDPYWNAAQLEMVHLGKMHNYMRMYWGKKILEWTADPAEAFATAVYLNDKYELDGRDPNGYAGVAWCFGKHDRPWIERPIFGQVRYMNDQGLKRKFDADLYVQKVNKAITSGRL